MAAERRARSSERLADLEGWSREGDAIVREFDRGDFVGSVGFVEAIVEPAEEMGHHPDLEISWATVTVRITTPLRGRPDRGRLRARRPDRRARLSAAACIDAAPPRRRDAPELRQDGAGHRGPARASTPTAATCSSTPASTTTG